VSFYYWRKVFAPDTTETKALKENSVNTLYIRYFDVDWPGNDSLSAPVEPVRFDSLPTGYTVIPVIFIHNSVFKKISAAAIPAFTSQISALVRRINTSVHINTGEVQFDCDWTGQTKDNYFEFLRQYQARSGAVLSSTIRLQQVRYAALTGIPPVDHGVLIFFNADSPVYDRAITHRYTPSLRNYPLPLDLALPIVHSASANTLLEMVGEVNRHSNHQIRNLIFFDLNHQSLKRYDRNLFKEILDHTD
jgi:hypothetical protein